MPVLHHFIRFLSAGRTAARCGRRLLLSLGVLLLGEQAASAYTDPGSGTLLWQMLVAGFIGGVFYLRKVATWIRGKDRKQ